MTIKSKGKPTFDAHAEALEIEDWKEYQPDNQDFRGLILICFCWDCEKHYQINFERRKDSGTGIIPKTKQKRGIVNESLPKL